MDDLTNDVAESTGPSDEGQSQESASPSQSTPESVQTSGTGRVNLFELPEFREFQSKVDRDRSETQRQLAETQRQAAEAAARLREYQLSGMDDIQRQQYELQEAKSQLSAIQRQAQVQSARNTDIENLSQLFGVPRQALEAAENYADALKISAEYSKQQAKQQAKAQAERAENNAVDIGGAGSLPKGRTSQAMAQAGKDKNAVAWLNAYLSQPK